jgi:hypothetical protein
MSLAQEMIKDYKKSQSFRLKLKARKRELKERLRGLSRHKRLLSKDLVYLKGALEDVEFQLKKGAKNEFNK